MNTGWLPRLGRLRQYAPRPLTAQAAPPPAGPGVPSISIVTPSFNQGRFLARTVASVLAQGYPRLEYFVQDGGSTDGTVEWLAKEGGALTGWASEPDNGQSQAINRGFARTSGDIMAWVNSDDLLLPGALDAVASVFAVHPEVDVVYGDRLMMDGDDREIGRWVLPGHDARVLSWADYIPQETVFWRRRIWEKVGGRVDESLRFAMDWDLLLRFRDAGAAFVHVPRFLGAFRVHQEQKTHAELDAVGRGEMDAMRRRALGRVPSRWERLMVTAPFLVRHMMADWRCGRNATK